MRIGLACGLVVGLLAVGPAVAAEGTEDARLEAFFRTYLDASFRAEPLSATRLGDHRFDDRLDDLSAAALAREGRPGPEDPGRSAHGGRPEKSLRGGRIDFEIFKQHLERAVWTYETSSRSRTTRGLR